MADARLRSQFQEKNTGRSLGIIAPKVDGLSNEDVIIVVMGPSGAGKTTFINTATGSKEAVSAFESCTREVAIVRSHTPDQGIVLIDTPGFTHDIMTDAEVLNIIAEWLKATYYRGIKLSGIIYLHKISDISSGTHRRNVEMFERLCGRDALQNVIIATTMWSKPEDSWELQQEQKIFTELYWKSITDQASATVRYLNTRDSAWEILNRFLHNKRHHTVRLQTEMVDLGRQLYETAAGRSWGIQPCSRLTLIAMVMLISKLLKVRDSKRQMPLGSLPLRLVDSIPQAVDIADLSSDDIIIALIGLTGTGKSSFIKMATGDGSHVGHGLESYTEKIGMVKVNDVVLVDTPGFDGAHKTDREILTMIADWLTITYKRDIKLSGILYLHRISDNRLAGRPLENLQLIERLCGKNAIQNVVLTTTMWDRIDGDAGTQREKELKGGCWKEMIKRGSKTVRYRNTCESAWDILDGVLGHTRLAVLLQREMVDMERQLRETQAGQALYNSLETLMKAQQEKLEEIRVETMRQANDHTALKRLQKEQDDLQNQLQNTISEMQQLKISVGKRFLRHLTFTPGKY